jgi:DNA-binding response OmpR family regulator
MPKVMLVEDDKTMLSLLRMLLEFEGYQVAVWEGDAETATVGNILGDLRREKPDLVLLDAHLHMLSGIDLLTQIRADSTFDHTRVLMSSGMELSNECCQEGADGFILKPYMPDELIEKISTMLSDVR